MKAETRVQAEESLANQILNKMQGVFSALRGGTRFFQAGESDGGKSNLKANS